MVRKKVRTRFLLLEKKSDGKEKVNTRFLVKVYILICLLFHFGKKLYCAEKSVLGISLLLCYRLVETDTSTLSLMQYRELIFSVI